MSWNYYKSKTSMVILRLFSLKTAQIFFSGHLLRRLYQQRFWKSGDICWFGENDISTNDEFLNEDVDHSETKEVSPDVLAKAIDMHICRVSCEQLLAILRAVVEGAIPWSYGYCRCCGCWQGSDWKSKGGSWWVLKFWKICMLRKLRKLILILAFCSSHFILASPWAQIL